MSPDEYPHLRFFNPYANIDRLQNRLPHWEQLNATYFVTFRLADSIPRALREQWIWERDAWLNRNPPPHTAAQEAEYHELLSAKMEAWLDAGMGSCALRAAKAANIVASAFHHFEGTRCHLLSFVIMPNHVHLLFATLNGVALVDLMYSWKSYTAHKLKPLLGEKWSGWQKDYFDRLVRDEKHFARCARYIHKNPEKARLSAGEYTLFESERAKMYLT